MPCIFFIFLHIAIHQPAIPHKQNVIIVSFEIMKVKSLFGCRTCLRLLPVCYTWEICSLSRREGAEPRSQTNHIWLLYQR